MNKQLTSFSKTRIGRMLALALPIGVLILTQACAPNSGPGPGRFIQTPVSRINQ